MKNEKWKIIQVKLSHWKKKQSKYLFLELFTNISVAKELFHVFSYEQMAVQKDGAFWVFFFKLRQVYLGICVLWCQTKGNFNENLKFWIDAIWVKIDTFPFFGMLITIIHISMTSQTKCWNWSVIIVQATLYGSKFGYHLK